MNYPEKENILKLIETNSDLNKIMSSGNTPLVEAIINKDYLTVQSLLNNDKVDINFEYKKSGHNTYALKACLEEMDIPGYMNFESGHKKVHKSEYEAIFDLLINNEKLKKTHILYDILFLETQFKDIEKIIENLKIDLNEQDEDGNTVLMKVLMEEGNGRPIGQNTEYYSRFLVSKGAILNIKNNKNEDCYSILEKWFDKERSDKLKNDLKNDLMTIQGIKTFSEIKTIPNEIIKNISSFLTPKKDGRKSSKRKSSKRKSSKRKSSKRKSKK